MVNLNNWHQSRISQLITKKLFGSLSQKKIAILGFAFKANTNDTRESAAIKICKDLLNEGALLHIHDPKVTNEQIEKDLQTKANNIFAKEGKNKFNIIEGLWCKTSDLYEAINNSDAILVLTEWDEITPI